MLQQIYVALYYYYLFVLSIYVQKIASKDLPREFDSFKLIKSYKPLKNGYFFVNF